MNNDKITVEIDGPRVRVNGHLVAEVAAGLVDDRDLLERNIDLHRIARHVLADLEVLHKATEGLSDDQAERLAAGFIDGFRGRSEPHPMLEGVEGTGVPRQMADREFRKGWDLGRTVGAMRRHLTAAADAA